MVQIENNCILVYNNEHNLTINILKNERLNDIYGVKYNYSYKNIKYNIQTTNSIDYAHILENQLSVKHFNISQQTNMCSEILMDNVSVTSPKLPLECIYDIIYDTPMTNLLDEEYILI